MKAVHACSTKRKTSSTCNLLVATKKSKISRPILGPDSRVKPQVHVMKLTILVWIRRYKFGRVIKFFENERHYALDTSLDKR